MSGKIPSPGAGASRTIGQITHGYKLGIHKEFKALNIIVPLGSDQLQTLAQIKDQDVSIYSLYMNFFRDFTELDKGVQQLSGAKNILLSLPKAEILLDRSRIDIRLLTDYHLKKVREKCFDLAARDLDLTKLLRLQEEIRSSYRTKLPHSKIIKDLEAAKIPVGPNLHAIGTLARVYLLDRDNGTHKYSDFLYFLKALREEEQVERMIGESREIFLELPAVDILRNKINLRLLANLYINQAMGFCVYQGKRGLVINLSPLTELQKNSPPLETVRSPQNIHATVKLMQTGQTPYLEDLVEGQLTSHAYHLYASLEDMKSEIPLKTYVEIFIHFQDVKHNERIYYFDISVVFDEKDFAARNQSIPEGATVRVIINPKEKRPEGIPVKKQEKFRNSTAVKIPLQTREIFIQVAWPDTQVQNGERSIVARIPVLRPKVSLQ